MWNAVIQKTVSALAMMVMISSVTSAVAAERTWTRSEILAIADQEAKKIGYDVGQMGVSLDIYNSTWRDYLKTSERSGAIQEIEGKLNDRHYWAVYYSPLKEQLGGDLFVFIDRNTREVLGILRGK